MTGFWGPRWRSHHGHQALVDVVVALFRPCAARAALREQALLLHLFRASYVCGIAWSALFFRLETVSRRQVHGSRFPAPLRPCAARAALREQALLLHLFRASYVCGIAWSALFFRLETVSRRQVHGSRFPAPLRPCAARAALREQALLLHLFRASYVCEIASTALFFRLGTASGPLSAWLGFFRRP